MKNEEQYFEEFMDAMKGLVMVLEHLQESTQKIADSMQKHLLLKGDIDLNGEEEGKVREELGKVNMIICNEETIH